MKALLFRILFSLCLVLHISTMTSYGATTLKVGVDENAPIAFKDTGGNIEGFSIDILEKICRDNDIQLKYIYSTPSDNIKNLENGNIDMMTLGYSESRAQRFIFTDSMIIENWGTLISSSPSASINSVSGKKVALVSGDIYADNFRRLASSMNINPRYVEVENYEDVFKLVGVKGVEFGVVSRLTAASNKYNYKYYESPMLLNPVEVRYAFNAGIDPKVVRAFNREILAMKRDKRSEYYEYMAKWFDVEVKKEVPHELVWFLMGLIFTVFVLAISTLLYRSSSSKKDCELLDKNKQLVENNAQIMRMNEDLNSKMQALNSNKKKMYKMAYYDGLTGLLNRNSLNLDLRRLCKKNDHFSIVFFDLDNFKLVNDTLGFIEGDKLLAEITKRLSEVIDDSTRLYRWGGDEFVFVCLDMHKHNDIESFCSHVLELFDNPVNMSSLRFFPTASLGTSTYPYDAKSHEDLIKTANAALHHVKASGKNGFKIHCSEISSKAKNRLVLDAKLRSAVENDEFHVYYQPRVNVQTGEIIGTEALVRWIDSTGKVIPPLDFIPLAEENGLIRKIGSSVLRKACIQTKKWNDRCTSLSVSVNLSSRQLEDKKIIVDIKNALEESGLENSKLELEITESSIIQNMESALEIIEEIRSMGIDVLLDDFGTGYSSLNYLRRMPIDILKIDKSFMDAIMSDNKEAAITSYIISLAHDMDLRVVAEGIESADQLEFLKEKRCDEFQGYYFSKPLPPEELEKLLK